MYDYNYLTYHQPPSTHPLIHNPIVGFLKKKGDSNSNSMLGMGGLMGMGMSNLTNLGNIGVSLLDNSTSTAPWQILKTHLNLLNDTVGDVSYVSSGYAPLSVRLVQAAAYNCWSNNNNSGGGGGNNGGNSSGYTNNTAKKSSNTNTNTTNTNVNGVNFNMDGVMRLLPGPMVEFTQYCDVIDYDINAALSRQRITDEQHNTNNTNNNTNSNSTGDGDIELNIVKKVMLVYVIGGLTYLEIGALRKLSKDPTFPYTIVMATTKVVNATTLLASMLDTSIRY